MTVMPVLFAIFINAAVTSLTWLTLPGAELMVSVYMVCMESMITSPGFSANIIADIASKLDAETMNRSRLFTFSLSALSLIWLADSSPDMYNMPASVSEYRIFAGAAWTFLCRGRLRPVSVIL